MQEDTDIASYGSCPTIVKEFIERLELLYPSTISQLLNVDIESKSNESSLDKCEKLASEIIEQRFTYIGSKNYLYLYLNFCEANDQAKNYYIDTACSVSLDNEKSDQEKIICFIILYFFPIAMCSNESSGRSSGNVWRLFIENVWVIHDKSTMNNMIRNRFRRSNIAEKLFITKNKEGVIKSSTLDTVLRFIDSGRIKDELTFSVFDSMRDSKFKVFLTCSSIALDLENNFLRKSLPGDLSTLRSKATIDFAEHQNKLNSFKSAMLEWLTYEDVVDNFMKWLCTGLSQCYNRYCIVHSGSGSDGKSSAFKVIEHVFGTYCGITPTSGPAVDTRHGGDVTTLANFLVCKRLILTLDVPDVVSLIKSPGFKSLTGGDTIYRRKMFQEAHTDATTLRALSMISTNQERMQISSASEVTRIRVIRWLNKTVNPSDTDLLPEHQKVNCRVGNDRYVEMFIKEYANVFLTELVKNYIDGQQNKQKIIVCDTIMRWTKEAIKPLTVIYFLEACTEKIDDYDDDTKDVTNALAKAGFHDKSDELIKVETLYRRYAIWKKGVPRYTRNDPYDLQSFSNYLSCVMPIELISGIEYVRGIRLKEILDLVNIPRLNNTYPQQINGGGYQMIQSLQDFGVARFSGNLDANVYL